MNTQTFEVTVRNSLTGLADLHVVVHIDPQTHFLTLDLDLIDSALILDLVTRVLPQEHGVIAFTQSSVGAAPSPSTFGLRIRFDGRRFGAQVFKLAEGGFTLRMEDSDKEFQRMARASAELVLRGLYRVGFEAVVGGLYSDGRLSTSEGALDVYVRRPQTEARIRIAQSILDSWSTVPMYLLSERELVRSAVERVFLQPHLAWDAATQRCVAGPADWAWT